MEIGGILGRILSKALDFWNTGLRVTASSTGLKLSIEGPLFKKAMDERIAKIEQARENLAEALSAVDDLKLEAEQNREDLRKIQELVDASKNEKQKTDKELEDLKKLAQIDAHTLRRTMGIPSIGGVTLQLLVGFVLGILASVIASIIWNYIQHFFGS